MKHVYIETSVLKRAEYIGNEPPARAAWFNAYLYCGDVENSGVIAGAAKWKDRQWQQSIGATLAEVQSAKGLLFFRGDDVHIAFYGEQARREKNGKDFIEHAKTMSAARWDKIRADREAKLRGDDAERPASGRATPSQADVRAEFQRSGGTVAMADAFFAKWEGLEWTDRGSPLIKWRVRVGGYIQTWRANDHAKTTPRAKAVESAESKEQRSASVTARIFQRGGKAA